VHGRMSVIAKGSRRPKSRFGSALQPMSYIQVVYYHRPARDLQMLKEADHVHRLRFLVDDLGKLTVGFRMVELVRALTEPGDAQPVLFNTLLHALLHLDAAPHRPANVLPHFQLRLAAALGFAPDLDREAVAAVPESGGLFNLDRGTISATASSETSRRASRTALRAVAVFARADLETALRMRLTEREYDETMSLVDAYLRHHVASYYPERTTHVARELRDHAGSRR